MRAACGLLPHAATLLLLLAAALVARPPGGAAAPDEAGIMGRLRQLAHDVRIISSDMHWTGWDPGDHSHHCMWHHVACDDAERVTKM